MQSTTPMVDMLVPGKREEKWMPCQFDAFCETYALRVSAVGPFIL
jgi:hypothetical protein